LQAESYQLVDGVSDSAPLIYLAKLEALDAFRSAGYRPYAPPAVVAETSRPEVSYRYPAALAIAEAFRSGELAATELDEAELDSAERLASEIPGLGRGECQVLAVARRRGWPALFFERRAAAIARTLGVATIDLVELLFAGTSEPGLLAARIRRFADLVDMRARDRDLLLERVPWN
jgi:hypothetical protein